jgi:hypothetical protein
MLKKNTTHSFLIFIVLFLHIAYSDGKQLQEHLWVLETYEHCSANTIVDNVKMGLLSQDVLLQDAACIILLKSFEQLKKGDSKSDSIFGQLSGDQKAVRSVADIIDSRLLGWYNPQNSEENEDDIRIYVPLFIILGKAEDKMARGTLARSFLYLRGHPDILEMIPMTEELASISLNMLEKIESKLCCVYPGREAAAGMFEKDERYTTLEMFENFLKKNTQPGEIMKKKMKEFILDCLNYGDAKNGYVIRIKAAKLAGMLVKAGESDLSDKIRDVAKTDPYYVHAYFGRTGYSVKELNYPVREMCSKILLQ